MKTENQLEQDILFLTTKIQKEFPELLKYLIEMPNQYSASDDDGVNKKNLKEYYDSLNELLERYSKEQLNIETKKSNEKKDKNVKLPGYPESPPSEGVYNQWKEEKDLNPEDITKKKSPNEKPGTMNEKNFSEDMSGSDLDIPGSELDDQQEQIGSEDEENNHYSLGGDAHNDLDEDNKQ